MIQTHLAAGNYVPNTKCRRERQRRPQEEDGPMVGVNRYVVGINKVIEETFQCEESPRKTVAG